MALLEETIHEQLPRMENLTFPYVLLVIVLVYLLTYVT
jgi:hypothetical protein